MLLRPAEPADAMGVARVHVRSWQAAYRGLLPDAYLDGLRAEDRAQRYRFASEDVRDPATVLNDRRWGDLRIRHDSAGARCGCSGRWRSVRALCRSGLVGPRLRCRIDRCSAKTAGGSGISERRVVAAGGQCSRGPFLSHRWVGAGWARAHGFGVGRHGG